MKYSPQTISISPLKSTSDQEDLPLLELGEGGRPEEGEEQGEQRQLQGCTGHSGKAL